jgi:hypothetical protein
MLPARSSVRSGDHQALARLRSAGEVQLSPGGSRIACAVMNNGACN